jgi:hypothetical protein
MNGLRAGMSAAPLMAASLAWFAPGATKTSEIDCHPAAENECGFLLRAGRRHGLQVEGQMQRRGDAEIVEKLAADLAVYLQPGEQVSFAIDLYCGRAPRQLRPTQQNLAR